MTRKYFYIFSILSILLVFLFVAYLLAREPVERGFLAWYRRNCSQNAADEYGMPLLAPEKLKKSELSFLCWEARKIIRFFGLIK